MVDELRKLLTQRELEVGWLIHNGFKNQEIAEQLKISPNTVKDHVRNIFQRLDVSTRAELAGLSIWDDSIENIFDSKASNAGSLFCSLDGLWLSQFLFDMHRRGIFISGEQFNLELIESQPTKNSYVGRNLLCSSTTKNRYFHKLQFEVFGNNVLGKWFNRNTNNIGCFQLYLHNNCNMMFGKHLGNASNNQIMCGEWAWIRVSQLTGASTECSLVKDEILSVSKNLKRPSTILSMKDALSI